MNMEIATNYETLKFIGIHSQSTCQLIIAHVNVDSWLRRISKLMRVINHKPPPHKPFTQKYRSNTMWASDRGDFLA
jgi:hypothetical protein